jgi:hypothetical protein
LTKSEKLHFIEFLGVLTGLLGVIVSVSAADLAFPSVLPILPIVLLVLIIFIAFEFGAYTNILSNDQKVVNKPLLQGTIVYFTVTLSLLFGTIFVKFLSSGFILSPTEADEIWIAASALFNFIAIPILASSMKSIIN